MALVRRADQLVSAGSIGRERFFDERVHPSGDQLQAEGHMCCVRRLGGQEERVSQSPCQLRDDARRSESAAHCKNRGIHPDRTI